jgi:hypothetical protein
MRVENRGKVCPRRFALVTALMGCLCGFQAAGQSRGGPCDAGQGDQQSLQVPVGTVLPVRLNHGFSSKNARQGQSITGRIMQDVPLPSAGKIPEGTKILGTIVSLTPPANNSGAAISFRFDRLEIHRRRTPVVTYLRALASFIEVEFAQIPEMSPGFGTPYVWATTQQVGGDEKYGVGGPVTDKWSQTVGTGVFDGVLVHVRAQPGAECRGAMDVEDRLQALWVFSSDACGVYGMTGVSIAHAGRTDPVGKILLAAQSGNLRLPGGSGILLRVVR